MSQTLRDALKAGTDAGRFTLYAAAKAATMKWDNLKNFMDGGQLKSDHLDKLADFLGFDLKPRTKARKPKA